MRLFWFYLILSITEVAGHDLKVMSQSIIHRGPDDMGHWFDADVGVGLAHQRLSNVVLSLAGHQSLHSACDRYVIAFNGEIYNHLVLRDRLQAENQVPARLGHSDTETLSACFAAWGIEQALQATGGYVCDCSVG